MQVTQLNKLNRKMNLPGTRIVRQYSWLRHFKYLLVVPVLIAVGYSSYRYGKQMRSLETNSEEQLVRDRREEPVPHTQSFTGGATYVRWGRTTCPPETELVYSGVAGGSLYSTSGGGSNYLCLPMEPLWGIYNEAVEKGSKLYGAEYEAPTTLTLDNNKGRPLQDNNVPCAVCRSVTKTSVVMIPARNKCYDGWKNEYVGYLMSGHPGQLGRTQFVCMDISPESDPAGFRDENGVLFYQVEGVCGSLPCPPYAPSREITCVVCAK